MADIRAFHAMRYTKSAGEAKELTCPPSNAFINCLLYRFPMLHIFCKISSDDCNKLGIFF